MNFLSIYMKTFCLVDLGIISSMFDCPRSKFSISNCRYCSCLYIDNQRTFFAHLRTLYRLVSARSIFSDTVVRLFEEHSIKRFTLEVTYKSDEEYKAVNINLERCLELFLCSSTCEIITTYCKLHFRFLYNFMWVASKDCTSG